MPYRQGRNKDGKLIKGKWARCNDICKVDKSELCVYLYHVPLLTLLLVSYVSDIKNNVHKNLGI